MVSAILRSWQIILYIYNLQFSYHIRSCWKWYQVYEAFFFVIITGRNGKVKTAYGMSVCPDNLCISWNGLHFHLSTHLYGNQVLMQHRRFLKELAEADPTGYPSVYSMSERIDEHCKTICVLCCILYYIWKINNVSIPREANVALQYTLKVLFHDNFTNCRQYTGSK